MKLCASLLALSVGVLPAVAPSTILGQSSSASSIVVGTNEPERMKSGLESLHTSLDAGGVQHISYESPGTDHEWQTWRRDLKDFAPRLFQSATPSR